MPAFDQLISALRGYLQPHRQPSLLRSVDVRVPIAAMLISIAQSRVDAQAQDWDSHDTKALGLVAVDPAAAGLLTAFRADLGGWWLSVAGLLVASGLFFVSIRHRRFNLGPDLSVFYDRFGASTELEAN